MDRNFYLNRFIDYFRAAFPSLLIFCFIACGSGVSDLDSPSCDLSGTWNVEETIFGNCSGSTYPEYETLSAKISQLGNNLSITFTSSGTVSGIISGNTVTWNGSLPEGDGTTTINFSGTVSSDGNSLTGTASWTWTDGNYTCSGTTTVNAVRTGVTPVEAGGDWNGTWYSSYGTNGTFTVNIVQSGSDLGGTIDVPYIGLNNAVLHGTISGSNITFGDIDNTITFTGTVSGNYSSGTYTYPGIYDTGTWSASRTKLSVIFSDDFNRTDSATVGNSWNEAECAGDSGKENDISLESNRMVFTGGYEPSYCDIPTASRSIDISGPFKATVVFSVNDNNFYYVEFNIYRPELPLLNNYTIMFQQGGDISVEKEGTIESLTSSYPLETGHFYSAVITLDSGDILISISADGGSSEYFLYSDTATPVTEFSYLMLGGGWHDGTNSYKTYIDSILIEYL